MGDQAAPPGLQDQLLAALPFVSVDGVFFVALPALVDWLGESRAPRGAPASPAARPAEAPDDRATRAKQVKAPDEGTPHP
jgi:hypothetical protein